jgi:hypothetical protein
MRDTVKTQPSRADLVRQRRKQNTQERVQRAQQVINRRDSKPRVVARSMVSTNTATTRPLGSARVRRQYYVVLGTGTAELRLPAVPLVNPSWRLLSALIVVLMLLAMIALVNAPLLQVKRIETTGLQRLTPADLEAVLGVTGEPAITLDPNALKNRLVLAFPELKNIQVHVVLPARLLINAQERQPVLAWQNGDQVFWIDSEGFILQPRGDAGTLPVVRANSLPPLFDTQDNVATASSNASGITSQTLPAGIAEVWGKQISPQLVQAILSLQNHLPADTTLVYDRDSGLGWHDAAGWDVLIGNNLDGFEAKMQLYEAIVAQIQQKGLQPQMISIAHLFAPFYK